MTERLGRTETRNWPPKRLQDFPDDTLVELELGALRELMGRLDTIVTAVTDHETHIQRGMLGAHPPLEALRAAGVTRYKAGDVEIELGPRAPAEDSGEPWPGAFEQLAKAAREAGWLDGRGNEVPRAEPADPPGSKRCPHCGELATLHYRGSECLGCARVGGFFVRVRSRRCHFLDEREPWLRLAGADRATGVGRDQRSC